jgi:hypothetical protein
MLEKSVLNSLPTGERSTMRDNYIWGRVRIPLEEYILESKSFLNSFCPTTILPPSSSSSSEESIHHPSTTFTFLSHLTTSFRRLELLLPSTSSPLSSHLLPYLLNAWHLFLTRLSTSLNTEGRMISAQLLSSWFDKWDELCSNAVSPNANVNTVVVVQEGPARKALVGVRDRARKELGWVVGVREVVGARDEVMGSRMEEEEEEEEL